MTILALSVGSLIGFFIGVFIVKEGYVQGLAKGYEVAIQILLAMTTKEREIIKNRLRAQVELKEQIEKRNSTAITSGGESGKRI